ncbi:hypothetical protein MOQ_007533, partial [Trypanosoma cruzi marinkellei]
MRTHARRARPGVPIFGYGLTRGCRNGATVFLTGALRAGRHRKRQACQQAGHTGSTTAGTRDGPGPFAAASSQTPRAADTPTDHGKVRLIHCGNIRVVGNWDCDCLGQLSPRGGPFATAHFSLLYGQPLRYSLFIVTARGKNNMTSRFLMNIGCASRGSKIHVVCGDLTFLSFLLCSCVAVCAAAPPSCVRVPSVRVAGTTDCSRRMYVRWGLVRRSCLLLLLRLCVGVVAGLCVPCVVCGVRCMPGC